MMLQRKKQNNAQYVYRIRMRESFAVCRRRRRRRLRLSRNGRYSRSSVGRFVANVRVSTRYVTLTSGASQPADDWKRVEMSWREFTRCVLAAMRVATTTRT